MTNDEIRDDIIGACREFVAAGFKLTDGVYCWTDSATDKPCGGCALTAVFCMRGGFVLRRGIGNDAEQFAGQRYGWRSLSVSAFVGAFDDDRNKYDFREECDYEAFDIGRAVRAAVLP